MRSRDESKSTVVAEEQALSVYLESLFLDIPDVDLDEELETAAVAEVVIDEPVVETSEVVVVQEEQDLVVKEEPEITALQPTVEIEQPDLKEQLSEDVSLETAVSEQMDSIVPDWGQDSFQCLLFTISGLTLAVPLAKLNGLIERPEPEEISDLPGHGDWYLGVFHHRDKTVKIANTDKIVLPKRMEVKSEEVPAPYIILVDNGHWGLRCDSIGNVVTLSEGQVKWRSERTSRRWLAGTVIEKMCALIDADELVKILENEMNGEG